MTATPAGFTVRRFAEVDSTNDLVADAGRRGEEAGLVIVAAAQRRGRGRQGRTWHSSPGSGLWMSVLRRPPVPAAQAPRWTLLTGLAIWAAASRLGLDGQWLKWPNDVLVGERKLAGVLCELSTRGGAVGHVVCGVGLNLRAPGGGWPPDLRQRATSLQDHGISATVDEALAAVLDELDVRERRLLGAGGVEALVGEAEQAMGPLWGRRVTVDGQPLVARGLDPEGRLQAEAEDGALRTLLAGDVHLGALG